MSNILQQIGLVHSSLSKSVEMFTSLCPNFFEVKYQKPSEYINMLWNEYDPDKHRASLNGNIFELIISTLLVREQFLPLYREANVTFVPNVIYDIILYSSKKFPICLSLKTSLRERYKQADLEAIALKYVHRKSECYLLTMDEKEADSVKGKVKTGAVLGLDEIVLCSSNDIDDLIERLKKYEYTEAGSVEVISSTQIVTKDTVTNILNHRK